MGITVKVKKSGEQTREFNTQSPTTVGAVLDAVGVRVASGQTVQVNGRPANRDTQINADCDIWILKASSNA